MELVFMTVVLGLTISGRINIATLDLECNETDVRLVDGLTPHDGRVEICFNGLWGSVCDDLWDARDAQVVCRQLGYDGSSTAIQQHPVKSNASLFYYLNNVGCSGDEDRLSECEHNGIGVHKCGVGLTISGRINIATLDLKCNETDVRLVDGRLSNANGRVEICFNGLWGSVCDDLWDARDAQVVCRQLGYVGLSISLRRYPVLTNELSLFYHLDNVYCRGDEDRLSECEH
ncbi:Scavenger receptor cysteine-rich domain superfamily protein, partial [Geodia barretti]